MFGPTEPYGSPPWVSCRAQQVGAQLATVPTAAAVVSTSARGRAWSRVARRRERSVRRPRPRRRRHQYRRSMACGAAGRRWASSGPRGPRPQTGRPERRSAAARRTATPTRARRSGVEARDIRRLIHRVSRSRDAQHSENGQSESGAAGLRSLARMPDHGDATGRVSRPRTTPGGRQESPHEPPSRATRPVILDVWARASARGRFGSATPESARAAERSCRRGRRLAGTVRLAPSPAFPAWVARLRRRQDLHRRRRTVSQRTADPGRAPSFQLRMPADPLKPRTTAVMGRGWSGWTRGRGGSRVLPSSCLTSRSRRRLGPAGPKASAVSPPI